jgi:hypothetical protein
MWLRSNISDVKDYFGIVNMSKEAKTFRTPMGFTFKHLYNGAIVSVSFGSFMKGQPTEELKWYVNKDKVIKKFGPPISEKDTFGSFQFLELKYNNISFGFVGGKLTDITVTRPITPEELSMDKKMTVDIELPKKPQASTTRSLAEVMVIDYKSMHDGLERNILLNNKYIKDYEEAVRLHLSGKAYDLEKSISRLKKESIEKIDQFLKKYDWTVTPEIKKHLLEDRLVFTR